MIKMIIIEDAFIILLLIMNIGSSIVFEEEQPTLNKISTISRTYGQTFDLQNNEVKRPKTKSSNSIRIKNKSTGFKNYKEPPGTSSMPNNHIFLDTLTRTNTRQKDQSIRQQLVFLRELVRKKKQVPERSFSQDYHMKNIYGKQESSAQHTDARLLECHSFKNTTTLLKSCEQYKHYDIMVRDLLSEMKTRKMNNEKKKRPFISPSKYTEAKCKIINRIPSGECNFKSLIKINAKKQNMIFRIQDSVADSVYEKKITSYVMFLYKINFTNAIYVDLNLSGNSPQKNIGAKKEKTKWKVKIGRGNNNELVKSLIKRRFWLQVLGPDDKEEANFIWTQATIDSYHNAQKQVKEKSIEELQKEMKPTISKKIKRRIKEDINLQINRKVFSGSSVEQSIEVERLFYATNNGAYSNLFKTYKAQLMTNHIPLNYFIGSKKILFMVMFWYYQNIKKIDPFTILPKTYHIRSGESNNTQFKRFLQNEGSKVEQVWIIKPGQNTNRGNGITVASLPEIDRLIRKREVHRNGEQKTFIIQKYLKPFLYNGRKFDIRHFLLITSVNGYIKAYWYKEGYIRTSSQKYDLEDLSNEFIHLTNDAIQKKSQLYGKYEPGNKISYQNFQRYLDQNYPHKKYSFFDSLLPKMKQITRQLIQSSFIFMDPHRKQNNFQLYGMDFMIDSKFHPFLIQVNANPCLETSCPLLQRIIPIVVEHSLRIGLDPLFPPPQHYPASYRYQLSDRILQKLKYQIIFDERVEGKQLRSILEKQKPKLSVKLQSQSKNKDEVKLEPDEQIFDNDGQALSDIDLE